MTRLGHSMSRNCKPKCYRMGYSVTPKAPKGVLRRERQGNSAIGGRAVALGSMKSQRLIAKLRRQTETHIGTKRPIRPRLQVVRCTLGPGRCGPRSITVRQ